MLFALTVPKVPVQALLRQQQIASTMSFLDVLTEALSFKIPVKDQRYVNQYADIFQWGRAEYECAVDTWLDYRLPLSSSETGIVQLDYNWQYVIESVIPRLRLLLNQHVASSHPQLSPDTVFMNEQTL